MSQYTKKGFKGHKRNESKRPDNFFPTEMTNKDKMQWRKDQREAKKSKEQGSELESA